MTAQATGPTWDVHAAPAEPPVTDGLPPRETQRRWSPASATLISGKGTPHSPTPLLTTGQARGLADWIAAHDRNLTAVYITQGHGDHRFGQCVSGAGNGSACGPARGRPTVPQAAVVPIVTRRHSSGLLKFATQLPEDSQRDRKCRSARLQRPAPKGLFQYRRFTLWLRSRFVFVCGRAAAWRPWPPGGGGVPARGYLAAPAT